MEKLLETYFFRSLDEAERRRLLSIARVVETRKGDLVLRQGQPTDNLYIVRSGSVRVMLPARLECARLRPAPEDAWKRPQ